MVESFPNLGRKIDIHINKVQKCPNRINPNKTTLRNITVIYGLNTEIGFEICIFR